MGSFPKSSSSSAGSRRAGASGGAREGRFRQSRMARIDWGPWMAASCRSLPPQRGHANASTANTLWSSSAHESLRARGRDGLRGCRPFVASLHAASLLIGLRASPRGSGSARSGAGFCGASGTPGPIATGSCGGSPTPRPAVLTSCPSGLATAAASDIYVRAARARRVTWPEISAELGVPDSAGGVTRTRARGRVRPFSGKLGGFGVWSFQVGDEVCRSGDTVPGLRWHSG